MKDKWTALYRRTFLTGKSLDKLSVEEREGEIRKQWRKFLDKDLPRIEAALKQETWIWDSVESDKARSSQESRFTWGEGDIEITKRPEHED
jgi:hypothetical protein